MVWTIDFYAGVEDAFVKKTQRTPKKELNLARARMKEVLQNE